MLGLLAGLFAMHVLAPAGAVATVGHASHHSAHASHSSAASAAMNMGPGGVEFVCPGDDSGSGGHAQHADAACASAALGAGPVLHAPLPAPVGPASPADRLLGAFAAASEGGRAPPTLAELQLLRI
ncbi:hypothetical protein DI272_24065 [Streptomyces sp. Act143]|nr:hypothetical protein DI272_24065 [Streptomyces sp. Act143]